jgi:L-lactate dehydrogenase complex protein LldG
VVEEEPDMNARDEILGSVRRAIAGLTHHDPEPSETPVPWTAGSVDLFCERVADYQATVHRTTREALAGLVAEVLTDRGIGVLGVPGDLPHEWLEALPPGVHVVADVGLGTDELDRMDGVVTGSRVAIAETGTIVLDHATGQGRRALSLVPDYHLCLVDADTIADDVSAAFAALEPTRPTTLISGPSATSDIELSRVEGVHGPRTLDVIVFD